MPATPPRRDIYFWDPSVSPHKIALYRAVNASEAFGAAYYLAPQHIPPERVAQGWSVAPHPSDRFIIGPDASEIPRIVENSDMNAVHIFSGIRHVPMIVAGLRAARRHKRTFGIMSEPRASEGVAGCARLLQSWLTEGPLRRNARMVLAIGRNGPPWFARAGYRPGAVFPFAYFLDGGAMPQVGRGARTIPTVAYVGRLETTKGFDRFAAALPLLEKPHRVEIIGNGSLRPVAEELARSAAADVRYTPALSNAQVRARLADVDVLILPSTVKDGWGAVVSEALLAGAAVVVSVRAGASVCVEVNPALGAVLETVTPQTIATAVDALLEPQMRSDASRLARATWAHRHLTGEAGARALAGILAHVLDGHVPPTPYFGTQAPRLRP